MWKSAGRAGDSFGPDADDIELANFGSEVEDDDDFNQDEFDFTELLEFIFVLQSSASANKFLQSALGITAQRARALVAEVSNLPVAQAFTKSLYEAQREGYNRLRLRQFWKDSKKK